jgi:hypothetical protein
MGSYLRKILKTLLLGAVLKIFLISGGIAGTVLPQNASDIHIGVTSCAGSTCHGATTPWAGSTVLQNEYMTWEQQDPHSKAYSILMNKTSKKIAENLGIGKAHEAKICLDCHADNVPKNKRGRVFQISDGVGCEACHGGGQRWLGLHVSGVGTHEDNVKAGLYPTEDPIKRAELCISCHFGDETKFVTHRIMGAGHPRMSFELDTFTSIQPAHYKIDSDYRKRKKVANGIQTWAIGQAMSLERRLDAVLDPKRNRDGIFPELVLFDCQACHHSLLEQKWEPRPGTGLGPGVVRFDDSNLLMLQIIVSDIDKEKGALLVQQTKMLHKATTESEVNYLNAAKALKKTSSELVTLFSNHKFGKKDVAKLLKGLVEKANQAEFSDYVGAEQAIMGISSVLSTADRMGMKSLAKSAKKAVDRAYLALSKYDNWDYAGFKSAVKSLKTTP